LDFLEHGRATEMSPEQINDLAADFRAGMKIKDISLKYNLRYQKVWSTIRRVPGMAELITSRKAENSRQAQLERYERERNANH
jgi:hypothetical protein